MANRVVFGNRGGGQYGLYISKPGFNVLTTGIDNLLFHPDQDSLQVVQSGTFNSASANISIPDLGYWPAVTILPSVARGLSDGGLGAFWYAIYNSNTSITLNGRSTQLPCVYKVWRIPVG